MAYGFEDQEYYYDPTGQMTVEPAGSSTVVSGIGSPAATVEAQPTATTATTATTQPAATTTLTPQQMADLQASAALMQARAQAGVNVPGGLTIGQPGTLSPLDPLYQYAQTAPVLTLRGNKEYETLRFQPLPGQMYRLIVNGQEVGRGNSPEGVANLVTAANQFSSEGGSRVNVRLQQEVEAMIDGRPQAVFADTYVNDPNNNGFLDIALPAALAVMGGVALGPLISATAAGKATALGLAAGVGAGTTAGNVLVGQPVDESLIRGLTAAATAYGGAGVGPIIGGGSFGVAAGAGGANLAANLAQGKSIEESLRSAAIAGVTAGVLHALSKGVADSGKTGEFTNAELRAAAEIGTDPVVGQSMNSAGVLVGPGGEVLSLEAARLAAALGVPASGIETAITVTASSLSSAVPGATAAAISNAVGQAFQNVNPADAARAAEDAARARQEQIAQMGDDSPATINARQAGFPQGFELLSRGAEGSNARRGDVYDQNGELVTRDWYNLSDAQKAALVAEATATAPPTPTVTSTTTGGGAAAGTAAGATAGIGGTTLDNVTITGSTPSADTAAGTGAGAVAGIDNTAPPATVTGETTGDTATAGGTAGAVAGIGGTTLDNITVTNTVPGGGRDDTVVAGIGNDIVPGATVTNTVPGGGRDDTVVAGIGNDIVPGATVTNTVPGGGRDDTVPGGTTLDNITVTNTVPGGGRDDTVPGGRDDDIIIVENPPTTPPTTPPAPPRTRTVSSILDLGTPEAVVQNQRLRERLALDPGIGRISYEDLLDFGDPEIRVENQRLRERLALTPGVGTVNYESILDLGDPEIRVQNQRMREQLALAPIVNTVVDPLDLGLPSKVINVTERRNPLSVSATPGSPTVLSEVLSVTPQDIINVTNQRNRIAPAPTATGPTTQRVTLNAQGEPEIRVSQQRNQVAPAPNVTGPRTERVTLNAQGEPETVVTGQKTGLPVNILPPTDPVQDILDSVDPDAPQKRTVLSTLKQISGLVPLIGLLGDAIGGDDDGGGVIDRGTGYATPTYGRQRNFYNDDPFTYGQRSGELRFFGNRTLLDPGLPPPTTTTTAGGGTAPPPPTPAGPYVPTAADIQAAFPGFTDIRQDDQGRWYGTPLADFKPSGQPLPTGRVTAAGSYTPSVEQVTYFNPGFESITRNAAGEFVGSRTEQLDAPPALTVEQVRARNPGYDSYEKNAQGQWVGIRAGTTPPPITEAQIREQFPGYDRYEQDAQGNWSGIRNPSTTTTQRPATEAQVRAQNPNYDAYEQDANGQWVGIKNIAGTTNGAMTEAQVRAANPDYDAFEQDASGGWYGIKNVQTSTPRAATEAQVRATNPNYDAYEQDANGQWVGIKNIAGTTSGVLTEAQVRAANPDYDAYEQDPSGAWYGVKNVETRTPSTLTLDQVRAQYGSNYDNITQNETGQFVGTRMLPGESTPMTLEQVRAAFPQYSRIEQLPTGEYYGITEVQEETPIPFTLADAQRAFGSTYSNITQNPQGQFMGTRTFTRAPTLQEVRGLGLGYEDFEQDEAGNYFGIRNVETRTPVPFTLADAQARFGSQYGSIKQNPQGQFVGVNTARFERPLTIDEVRRLAPGYQDYEQGDDGFYGIRNVETRTPVPYTLADAQQRFGSQYGNIYQDPQRGFVGVGTREVPRAPTIEDAQRQYGSAYDAYEQGDEGIYGIRNTTMTAPGSPFTLDDARARFPGYENYFVNDQGQFVGEKTEAEPTFAEGGEVYDDMVSHLISYRKGGGHMGPGKVSGIGSGQEDKIPAWLSDGEYVWSAQDVADLGDGSTDEGVRRLDRMRQMVRKGAGRKDVKKIAKPQRGIEDMLKAVGGKV